ncbi:unnamed protein product, partial [Didymodactylos carnosus]
DDSSKQPSLLQNVQESLRDTASSAAETVKNLIWNATPESESTPEQQQEISTKDKQAEHVENIPDSIERQTLHEVRTEIVVQEKKEIVRSFDGDEGVVDKLKQAVSTGDTTKPGIGHATSLSTSSDQQPSLLQNVQESLRDTASSAAETVKNLIWNATPESESTGEQLEQQQTSTKDKQAKHVDTESVLASSEKVIPGKKKKKAKSKAKLSPDSSHIIDKEEKPQKATSDLIQHEQSKDESVHIQS